MKQELDWGDCSDRRPADGRGRVASPSPKSDRDRTAKPVGRGRDGWMGGPGAGCREWDGLPRAVTRIVVLSLSDGDGERVAKGQAGLSDCRSRDGMGTAAARWQTAGLNFAVSLRATKLQYFPRGMELPMNLSDKKCRICYHFIPVISVLSSYRITYSPGFDFCTLQFPSFHIPFGYRVASSDWSL